MRLNSKNIEKCLPVDCDDVIKGVGGNIIPPPEKEPLWKLYLEKFKDPIIIVLIVVFALSLMVSIYEVCYLDMARTILFEPLGVVVALLLATTVGFVFEVKADREFDILNKVKDDRPVKVYRRRGNQLRLLRIKRQDVVVGDVVKLESGDEIPADGELLQSNSLRVDESNFTGELYATKTTEEADFDADATYPSNFMLRGATVIEGTAIYKVTAIGMHTEEGRGVARTQEGSDVETPLNKQLAQLGRWISIASFVIASLIVVGRMIYFFFFDGDASNHTFLEIAEFALGSLMIAVTLIVVAVPEGLPMSVTVSLALSMRKMLRENNLVRKLHACETMGAATVICTDKTGTLTKNRMRVVETDFYGGEAERELIIQNMSVNSTADVFVDEECQLSAIGNPTEVALIKWVHREGFNYEEIRNAARDVKQIPFSTETKIMETSAVVGENGRKVRLVKGAPEIVLEMCGSIAGGVTREHINETLAFYQSKAMRTLGFAYQWLDEEGAELVFVGVVGITDPIRDDVPSAIRTCKNRAGVRVIIVTGDTPGTANEIGRQIGLLDENEPPQTLTGPEFAAMSDEEAEKLVADKNFKIISRARPDDKARLVMLLQRAGEVVAVTGDGTNDAPALSKAQVGLSMGDGTSRAKEASDITIIDNSFASINKAIKWGRSLYKNIQRFIVFQMTINFCACLIVLLGAFIGLESPLTVTQMLWVNLIMDTFAAMALSSLPADKRVLDEMPRNPQSHILNRYMVYAILLFGSLFFLALVAIWQQLHHIPGEMHSVTQMFSFDSIKVAVTGLFDFEGHKTLTDYERGVFFSIFVMMQFWNLFNVRFLHTDKTLFGELRALVSNRTTRARVKASYSWGFVIIALLILVGQILIVTFAGPLFSVDRLSFVDWVLIILMTMPTLLFGLLFRTFGNKSYR